MPKVELRAGATIDTLNEQELRGALEDARRTEFEWLRGIKPIRLPTVSGTASGSALSMGGDSGVPVQTPAEGFVWAIRHLVIEGMTANASTPDVVNVKSHNRIIWQLNGNQFCQTFSRGAILIYPGETLSYVSVGSFAATGTIVAHGLAENVPAEMIGKLY